MKKIAIIGGGIGALMCAYKLSDNQEFKIDVFEKGKDLSKRTCPILKKISNKCLKCKSCAIMEGVSGAGAFSDGKYNITSEFGGWLQDYISPNKLIGYEYESDEVLVRFGATTHFFNPNNELKKLCLQHDLHMQQSHCKHLGTDDNFQVMVNFVEYLGNLPNVNIYSNHNVTDVVEEQGKKLITVKHGDLISGIEYDIVIFAVGRSGSGFFLDWCIKNNIPYSNNQIDVGVRVELPSVIWEDFEKQIYEPKIWYKTKKYGDRVRMFCFNGRGEVVNENTSGIITVNGHAYEQEEKKTNSSNFALLATINFTQPFKDPIKYAKHIAELSNMISGGSVIVQTLGDLRRGRRTDESRLKKCTTEMTLTTAIPGDLSLCIPKRQLDNILETLEKLDEIAPGTNNDDTLLYGIECKYYSARPECDDKFMIANNIYAIGDGCGFTRSLAQASAHGLLVADYIKGDN